MSPVYVHVVGPLVMPKGHAKWRLASSLEPEGNPEATPECDAHSRIAWSDYVFNTRDWNGAAMVMWNDRRIDPYIEMAAPTRGRPQP